MSANLVLLPIFPGEHVLGYLARSIFLNGALSNIHVQALLAGEYKSLLLTPAYHSSFVHLVPTISDAFQMSKETIYCSHTTLGLYRHAMDYLTLHKVSKNHRKVPFYPHGTQAFNNERWRFCKSCIDDDIKTHGSAYWHVEHQLPTSLTCYRHPEQMLLAKCSHCQHVHIDLRDNPVPSHYCNICMTEFINSRLILNREQRWLQHVGIELFRDRSKFADSTFKYMFTYQTAYRFSHMHRVNGQNRLYLYGAEQQKFLQWLFDNELDQFFSPDFDITNYKALGIDRLCVKPRYSPLMAHLLWLRFLNVDDLDECRDDVSV